jgi:hypothetical protein
MDRQPGPETAGTVTTDQQPPDTAGTARNDARAPEPAALTWTRAQLREQIQRQGPRRTRPPSPRTGTRAKWTAHL